MISEIYVDVKISRLQMIALKAINYPRVFFGFDVYVPRWCVSVGKLRSRQKK